MLNQDAAQHENMMLHPDYVCHRCNEKGHHIKNCPKNNDKNYDQVKKKGTPAMLLWQYASVRPERFVLGMQDTMRGIIRQSNLYVPEKSLAEGKDGVPL